MAKIFHASLHGLSRAKDQALLFSDIGKTKWSDIDIEASEFYLLIPQSYDLRVEYGRGWKITDIFPVNSIGMQTHRDYFITDIDRNVLMNRIRSFRDSKLNDAQLREEFDIGNLNIAKAQSSLRSNSDLTNQMVKCLWRPFDTRNLYYDKNLIDRPRAKITDPGQTHQNCKCPGG